MTSPLQYRDAIVPADLLLPSSGERTRTSIWVWVGVLTLATVAVAWATNEFVLTADTYRSLLATRLDAARIDETIAAAHRFAKLSYALAPVSLFLRLGIVTLVLQLFLLLMAVEVPLREIFRTVVVAYPATIAASRLP